MQQLSHIPRKDKAFLSNDNNIYYSEAKVHKSSQLVLASLPWVSENIWTLNSKTIETGKDCRIFLPRRKFSLQVAYRTQGIECSGLNENDTIDIYNVCWIPVGKTVSED